MSIAVIALPALSLPSRAASIEDHLTPRWPQPDLPKYYALLQRKLMITAADCGRLIVIPSPSFGEESVAVWAARSGFRATHTKASRNIWYAANSPRDPEYGLNRRAVTVSRSDVDIPASTALAIRDAWAAMLRGTAPRGPSSDSERIVLDGTTYEFLLGDTTHTMVGVATDDRAGKNTSELLEIGDLLFKYCHSNSARRAGIAQIIQRKANQLVSRLRATDVISNSRGR